jgi:hypothetical protein
MPLFLVMGPQGELLSKRLNTSIGDPFSTFKLQDLLCCTLLILFCFSLPTVYQHFMAL